MSLFSLITLDYPPNHGGVARYVGELVRAAGGDTRGVVETPPPLSGPGHVEEREFFWKLWPKWWPMVRVCREQAKHASHLLVSHVLPVGTAALIARKMGGLPYVVICHGLDVRVAAASGRKRWLFA